MKILIVLGIFLLLGILFIVMRPTPMKTIDRIEKDEPTYRSGADYFLDPVQYMNPQQWNLAGTVEGMQIGGIELSNMKFGYCESNPNILRNETGSNCPKPPDSTPPDSTPPDSKPPDSKPPDSKPPDSKPPDSTPPDSTPPDSTPPDSTPQETALEILNEAKQKFNSPEKVEERANAKQQWMATEESSEQKNNNISELTAAMTDWLKKNTPPPPAPYPPPPPPPPPRPPPNPYKNEYPAEEPVQNNPYDVKPGINAYNTSTVFIPPPIGGGQQKNTCPEPAPCPACARCPEPSFDCKKVPNYSSTNSEYLPMPVLSDFSSFGM